MRRMRDFNLALLEKWCWRMLVDRAGLWYMVLVARYGEEDGTILEGGRRASVWWRELVRVRDSGRGVGGGWFRDNVSKIVGNVRDTYFWTDTWLGGVALSVRFRRLHDLSVNKNRTVEEMFAKGWGEGGEKREWRRRLWDWEEELVGECRLLLANVIWQDSTADAWSWHLDDSGSYSVRSLYDMLIRDASNTVD